MFNWPLNEVKKAHILKLNIFLSYLRGCTVTQPVTLRFSEAAYSPIGRRVAPTSPTDVAANRWHHGLDTFYNLGIDPKEEGYSGSLHPWHNVMLSHRTFGVHRFYMHVPHLYMSCPNSTRPAKVVSHPSTVHASCCSLRWSYGNRHSQHDTPLGQLNMSFSVYGIEMKVFALYVLAWV